MNFKEETYTQTKTKRQCQDGEPCRSREVEITLLVFMHTLKQGTFPEENFFFGQQILS